MKKTIYSIIAVTVGVILTGGCSKEINPVQNDTAGKITLSASFPGELTKAAVDGTNNTIINWSKGDEISVWGDNNCKFTLEGEGGTKSGSFTGTISGTAQYAMSPYSESATIDGSGIITTKVPTTQTAPAGSFDPAAAIVVGSISETTITFLHALAYLKITAPDDVDGLIEITIESNGGVQLTGDAKFAVADGAFTATGTACKYVTIKPSTGTFTAGSVYYAAVIPGTYTGGLTVRYLYNDDSAHTMTEKTKSNSTVLELSTAGTAKLLGAATSFDHTYDAVQLWENGPYWATTNIGASASTGYGQYFAWGYAEGCVRNSAGDGWVLASDGTTPRQFNTDDFQDRTSDTYQDAAGAAWGTGWSVPTYDDFTNLINITDYTSIEYVKSDSEHWSSYNVIGILVTGKTDGYTSNSIFLPAAGYGDGSELTGKDDVSSYWSSVQANDSDANYLYFRPAGIPISSLNSCEKYFGSTIRPVRSSDTPSLPEWLENSSGYYYINDDDWYDFSIVNNPVDVTFAGNQVTVTGLLGDNRTVLVGTLNEDGNAYVFASGQTIYYEDFDWELAYDPDGSAVEMTDLVCPIKDDGNTIIMDGLSIWYAGYSYMYNTHITLSCQ